MARTNISLPDELLAAARAAGLNVSELARDALADELARRARLEAAYSLVDQLDAEFGVPNDAEVAEARDWADRVVNFGNSPDIRPAPMADDESWRAARAVATVEATNR